ncbi:MAG: hypothetical protein WAV00_10010 [Nocardioides sp.]
MTALATRAAAPATSVLLRLARIEALRYARHPLFVIGLLLALASSGTYGPVELDHQVVPAFFIGVFGIVVASRLTTSTDTSRPVVAAAPVVEPVRTAALCLACAVPASAGLLVVVVHRILVQADPPQSYEYAGYGATDRLWITIAIPVVACAGGPLLGVLVGRWLRFPGATVLAVLAVLLWSQVGAYYPAQRLDSESLFARTLHLFTPYTAFLETNAGSNAPPTLVTAYTGSAFWFLVWTVALCVMAASAAIARGATGRLRRVVVRWFAAAVAVAAAALILGVSTGADHLVYYTPDGHSGPVKPAVPDA